MSQLSELIESLQQLEKQGHGGLEVHAVVGSSGVAYELSHCFLREAKDASEETGPFDVTGPWIEVYAGN